MSVLKSPHPTVAVVNPFVGFGSLALKRADCIVKYHVFQKTDKEHEDKFTGQEVLSALYAKNFPTSKELANVGDLDSVLLHSVDILLSQTFWNHDTDKNQDRDVGQAINDSLGSRDALNVNSPGMIIMPLLPKVVNALAPKEKDDTFKDTWARIPTVAVGSDRVCHMSYLALVLLLKKYPIIFSIEVNGQEVGMAHQGRIVFLVAAKRLDCLGFDPSRFLVLAKNDYGMSLVDSTFHGIKRPPKRSDHDGWSEVVDKMENSGEVGVLPAVVYGDTDQKHNGVFIAGMSRTPAVPLWHCGLVKIAKVYHKIEAALTTGIFPSSTYNQSPLSSFGIVDPEPGIPLAGVDLTSSDAVLPQVPWTCMVMINGSAHKMPKEWFTPHKIHNGRGSWSPPKTSDTVGWQWDPVKKRLVDLGKGRKPTPEVPQLREEACVFHWERHGGKDLYLKARQKFNPAYVLPATGSTTEDPNRNLSYRFVAWEVGAPFGWFDHIPKDIRYKRGKYSRKDVPTGLTRLKPLPIPPKVDDDFLDFLKTYDDER